MSELVPFVKWAGGKRQLLPEIQKRLPAHFHTYHEPFVGGGAVLFALQPESAIISDSNRALIHTYESIRDNPGCVFAILESLDKDLKMKTNRNEFYLECRQEYNHMLFEDHYSLPMAAFFIFLNKHCFNGLYRVNKKGWFNVPYNKSVRPSADRDLIYKISDYLRQIEIRHMDFSNVLSHVRPGDFVFLDSPYAPLDGGSFTSYTSDGFSLDDHRRLAWVFDELSKNGICAMLTNHNTALIRELYGGKGYRMDVVPARRMINSDASKRSGEEIIICNY